MGSYSFNLYRALHPLPNRNPSLNLALFVRLLAHHHHSTRNLTPKIDVKVFGHTELQHGNSASLGKAALPSRESIRKLNSGNRIERIAGGDGRGVSLKVIRISPEMPF